MYEWPRLPRSQNESNFRDPLSWPSPFDWVLQFARCPNRPLGFAAGGSFAFRGGRKLLGPTSSPAMKEVKFGDRPKPAPSWSW